MRFTGFSASPNNVGNGDGDGLKSGTLAVKSAMRLGRVDFAAGQGHRFKHTLKTECWRLIGLLFPAHRSLVPSCVEVLLKRVPAVTFIPIHALTLRVRSTLVRNVVFPIII